MVLLNKIIADLCSCNWKNAATVTISFAIVTEYALN